MTRDWRYWARWLLVLPAAFLVLELSLIIGVVLFFVGDGLCSTDQGAGWACEMWRSGADEGVAGSVAAAVAAPLLLLGCTIVAPGYRRVVARSIFIVGACVCLAVGIGMRGMEPAAVTGVIAGSVAIRWLHRRRYLDAPSEVAA